jgi:Protein of unknown function (DUF3489)
LSQHRETVVDHEVGKGFDQRHQRGLPRPAPRIPRRSSKFITVETCHRPPRRVSMPRSFSSAAIARRLVAPLARMSSTTGARSRACRSAFRAIAARSVEPPATGWQPHTVRGAFAGALEKKLDLTVVSEKLEGGERVYRIA